MLPGLYQILSRQFGAYEEYAYLAYVGALIIQAIRTSQFIKSVIQQLCKALGIKVFSIKYVKE